MKTSPIIIPEGNPRVFRIHLNFREINKSPDRCLLEARWDALCKEAVKRGYNSRKNVFGGSYDDMTPTYYFVREPTHNERLSDARAEVKGAIRQYRALMSSATEKKTSQKP